MTFRNPPPDAIAGLLRAARTIAVVGLSGDPGRPSHRVARSMQRHGYRIVPVNPRMRDWNGLAVARSLDEAVAQLAPGERIDIVDVFRRPEHVAGIVADCVRLGLPALWLQLGVVDERAARTAQDAGMTVVMDRCISVDRASLG
jgi:predicted CoA-binding protein